MTEKLKVSREVADAIEYIKNLNSIEEILVNHSVDADAWVREAKAVNDLSLSELATALIAGYEVEMTPHEVIASEYVTRQQDWVNNMHLHSKGFVEGIEFTLNTLSITVEGVKQNGESFRI